MTGTLHEDRYTSLIVSRSVLLRMKNVSNKRCTENQNTHFVYSKIFFENLCVYEIILKNVVQRGRPHMKIRRIRIARWITKATDKHSEYVIIILLPQQEWLRERASMSRYTQITCHVTWSTDGNCVRRPINPTARN